MKRFANLKNQIIKYLCFLKYLGFYKIDCQNEDCKKIQTVSDVKKFIDQLKS